MILSKKNIATLYLVLLTLAIYSPTFKVMDKMAIQNLLLSITNVFALVSIPLLFKKVSFHETYRNPLLLLFIGYIIIAVLSMIKSINLVESSVRIGQLLTFAFTLFILIFFINQKLIRVNFILTIILFTLTIDMFFSLKEYIPFLTTGIPYTYDENTRLVGLYGNRNILATVLSFKIPLAIIFALRINKKFFYLLVFLIVTVAFYNISLLASRATYLAIIISIIFMVSISLFKFLRDKRKYFLLNRSLFVMYFIPCLLAFFLSTIAIDSSDQGAVVNRISTITSSNDVSKNTRLRYYSHSIEHLLKNPILGAGIGNWKIWSVKYDSKNIENYIIPYNAHNDILEAAAETGFIGGIFFLTFFLLLLYYVFLLIKRNLLIDENYPLYILLVLPFIIYFIDLNLNFPSSRPANQYFYLLYLSIVVILKSDIDEKE
jgi:O-antigen ligase